MKLNDISLPYPVLGVGDDITPSLPINCVDIEDPIAQISSYKFQVTLRHGNLDIDKYISDGFAEYSCEIKCQKTFMRKCLKQSSPVFEFEIPRKSINGHLEFDFYVSVKQPIFGYKNSCFNKDYEGYNFNLEPGDILVAFPSAYYDVDINYDRLQAAGSFMVIKEDPEAKETKFDIAGNKIEIVLPSDMFSQYQTKIGSAYASLIHASLVFNALTYALYNFEDNKHTTWARTILYRIDSEAPLNQYRDFDKEQVPQLAQALLQDPYRRMFDYLYNLNLTAEED